MKDEKIMCSAIWIGDANRTYSMVHRPKNVDIGIVICGYRHCDCLELASLLYSRKQMVDYGTVQGFLTNNKRFVDRIEARQIAEKQNQLLWNCSNGEELYSEDVWLINQGI